MADTAFSLAGKRVWVAGHRGMVGAALVRRLASENCVLLAVSRDDVDLRRQEQVERWIAEAKPQVIFVAAAKVGGILANATYPVQFLYDNLMIEANIIEAAYRSEVEKLLFLGSSCIYPKFAPQPISEEDLLTGALEPTNECYAIAKIAGIRLCQAYRTQHHCDFISVMPANLYGPDDNFSLETSHVIPALLRKAHEAKIRGSEEFVVWGSGKPRREFLHVDDCADACVYLMKRYSGTSHVNVGAGSDVTITELADLVAAAVGFSGHISYEASRPDGTPRKLLNSARLAELGWTPHIVLEDGLRQTYQWFLENRDRIRTSA